VRQVGQLPRILKLISGYKGFKPRPATDHDTAVLPPTFHPQRSSPKYIWMLSFHFILSVHFPGGFAIKSVSIPHFPSTATLSRHRSLLCSSTSDDFIANEQSNLSVYRLSRIPDKSLSISVQVTDTKQSYVWGFYVK